MTKRGKLCISCVSVFFAAGIVLWLVQSSGPVYQGRQLDVWLDEWAAHVATPPVALFQEIGTNVWPHVIRNLALNDSNSRRNYFELRSRLPTFLQTLLPKPKPALQVVDGANVFFFQGSNSIPTAIALLKHDSPTVRRAAASGLSALRRVSTAPNQAIPALIEGIRVTNPV